MSWRQGIEGTPGTRPNSMAMATPTRSERSISPAKGRTPVTSSAANLASEARRQPYANSIASASLQPASPSVLPTSPTGSVTTVDRDLAGAQDLTPQTPTPGFSFRGIDDRDDAGLRPETPGASFPFWNLNRWRGIGGTIKGGSASGPSSGSLQKGHGRANSEAPPSPLTPDAHSKDRRKSMNARVASKTADASDKVNTGSGRKSLPAGISIAEDNHLSLPGAAGKPIYARQGSFVSILTSEELTSEGASEEGEEMQCTKCGGHEFKAKKVGGQQRFLCAGCGRMVDA